MRQPAPSTLPLLSRVEYIFLDRDGVINVKLPTHQYVTHPDTLELCPGAGPAIGRLNRAGIPILVVTNQRGIALGLYSEQELAAIHLHLRSLLAAHGAHLDAIYYCPHDHNACACRKPLPGMFQQAFADFPGANPANSLLIGDSLSDIQAGHALDIPTVFVAGPAVTRDPGTEEARRLATYTAPDLAAFTGQFLSRSC